jgi:hypothetical protein
MYLLGFVSGIGEQDAFTWMDPYQYYDFARDLAAGERSFNQFELPSIFPWFVAPFLKVNSTIESALCANLLFLAALGAAVYSLCRHFGVRKWHGAAVVALLCSPLILGLSRSLYVELALSALVAWQYVLWFRSDNFRKPWPTAAFMLLFCIGMMTKSTCPLFFTGLFIWESVRHAVGKDCCSAFRLSGMFFVPVAAVVLIQKLLFPASFEYYTTGFYTNLPVMRLIGPSQESQAASIGYYFVNIWKTQLYLLTPLLAIPLLPGLRKRQDLYLWLWFVAALVVFTLPQVKEPRHVAPAIVPAIMLIVLGISRIRSKGWRNGATVAVVLLSLGQYLLVTHHLKRTPYLLDRSSYVNEMTAAMAAGASGEGGQSGPVRGDDLMCWKFTKNFIVTGYDAPMALSLAWNLGPGVTYAVDFMRNPGVKYSRYGYEHFEDLFLLESFNTYNRQCLWNSNYLTLDTKTVIDNADYLIAGELSPDDLESRFPGFNLVRYWKTSRGTVRLLKAPSPSSVSYRTIYARQYLAEGSLDPATTSAIYFDLIMNAALRRDSVQIRALQKVLAPMLSRMPKPKNIYWIRNRSVLIERMNTYLSKKPPG